MSTSPRDPQRAPLEERGATRTAELIDTGRAGWEKVQRSHPWRTVSHFTDVGGSVLSAGMSYQALFAVFAGLWVGFGVFGIVLRDRTELIDSLTEQIDMLVPGLLGEHGIVSIQTLLAARALDITSIVAGLTLLWVVITWFTGTRRAIRIIFGLEVKQYKHVVLLKLRDFVLAICFAIAILLSAGLTVFSSTLMGSVYAWMGVDPDSWFLGGLGTFARYAAMYVFDVFVLIAIHRFLAEVRVPRLRLIVGCALGGAALLGIKLLGTLLLGGATSNPLLASFAVLIGLLIWFNLLCRTLLLTASWIATGLDKTLGLPSRGGLADL